MEASRVLYEKNGFHILGTRALLELGKALSAESWSLIRHVRLSIGIADSYYDSRSQQDDNTSKETTERFASERTPADFFAEWPGCWDALSKLTDLRTLQVEFGLPGLQELWGVWSEAEFVACEVLEPLSCIGGPDGGQRDLGSFVIRGNWSDFRAQAMVGCLWDSDNLAFRVHGRGYMFDPLVKVGSS
jgi:hypothetical protein